MFVKLPEVRRSVRRRSGLWLPGMLASAMTAEAYDMGGERPEERFTGLSDRFRAADHRRQGAAFCPDATSAYRCIERLDTGRSADLGAQHRLTRGPGAVVDDDGSRSQAREKPSGEQSHHVLIGAHAQADDVARGGGITEVIVADVSHLLQCVERPGTTCPGLQG